MKKFAEILSASAHILPLSEFLNGGQKGGTKAVSFGLFAPLANMIFTSKGVRDAHILHPFCMDFGADSENVALENAMSENSASENSEFKHSAPFHFHFHTYEIGTEHAVAALLARLDSEILDIGYISSESNFGEEEALALREFLAIESEISIILGRDLYLHENSEFIAQMICEIAQKSGAKIYLQDLDSEILKSSGAFEPDFAVLDDLQERNGAMVYECKSFELAALESMLFEKMLGMKQHDKDYRPFRRAKDYFALAGCENLIFAPHYFGAIFGKKPQSISTNDEINFYTATFQGVNSESVANGENDKSSAKICILDFLGTIGVLKKDEIAGYPFKKVVSLQ